MIFAYAPDGFKPPIGKEFVYAFNARYFQFAFATA